MAVKYKIHIVCEHEGIDQTIECPDDQTILEAAEEESISLPYSCRAGACSSCAGKLIKGEVDQAEQAFLEEEQLDKGFILTCVAYPRTDLELTSHVEDDIFD
uniref:Ferredoxin n=1 Tax=Akkesiphycus lubricus TaxID=3022 RepID=A0A8F0F6X7_AKKLU|nr:ferredoxin [Akkesiphycus lubricus]